MGYPAGGKECLKDITERNTGLKQELRICYERKREGGKKEKEKEGE